MYIETFHVQRLLIICVDLYLCVMLILLFLFSYFLYNISDYVASNGRIVDESERIWEERIVT